MAESSHGRNKIVVFKLKTITHIYSNTDGVGKTISNETAAFKILKKIPWDLFFH